MLRRVSGPKRDEVAGGGEDSTVCTLYQIILGDKVKETEIGGTCSAHREIRDVQHFGWEA
jgi:hypothetical protein